MFLKVVEFREKEFLCLLEIQWKMMITQNIFEVSVFMILIKVTTKLIFSLLKNVKISNIGLFVLYCII